MRHCLCLGQIYFEKIRSCMLLHAPAYNPGTTVDPLPGAQRTAGLAQLALSRPGTLTNNGAISRCPSKGALSQSLSTIFGSSTSCERFTRGEPCPESQPRICRLLLSHRSYRMFSNTHRVLPYLLVFGCCAAAWLGLCRTVAYAAQRNQSGLESSVAGGVTPWLALGCGELQCQ